MIRKIAFLFSTILMISSCQTSKTKVDLILKNATIYTIDSTFSTARSLAISNGKIVATGSEKSIRAAYVPAEVIDVQGKFVYPGFIDAHSHFTGYAVSLQMADLTGLNSFDEVIDRLKSHRQQNLVAWLVGRGWDQNRWPGKEFPTNKALNEAFPEIPVVLIRIDGHAVIVNDKAMNLLDISNKTRFPEGEAISSGGKLTGVFLENTADRFKAAIPPLTDAELSSLLLTAQQNCFAAGLTSVCDAGLSRPRVMLLDSLQTAGQLKMRVYAMLDPSSENIASFVCKGTYITPKLSVRSLKLYADGALGSRGARLIEPYSDAPGLYGIWVTDEDRMKEVAQLAFRHGYQLCVHAIGDAAVRKTLDVYSQILPADNDLRWRVEHAQVVHPDDFDQFGTYNIVPSIQSTHATSDMPWAESRLGSKRVRFAYAQKMLLSQNGWIPNGTDFPIEGIHPVHTFFAAVARRNLSGFPEQGWQMENALTREEALRSITIWAAKAAFEDAVKGSLEPGKVADFVILDRDLLTVPDDQIPAAKVIATYLDGKKVF